MTAIDPFLEFVTDQFVSPADVSARTAGPRDVGDQTAPDGYRLTDLGHGQRLVERYRDHIRYVATWGKWVTYADGRWMVDVNDVNITRLAASIGEDIIAMRKEVERGEERRLVDAALRLESASGAAAAVAMARTVEGVAITHDALDQEAMVLNVRNGTLDLNTGKLRPHNPDDLLTKQARAYYDPHATPHRFINFVERVLPDESERRFVQRLLGYAITGAVTEHVLPIAHGNGANGKTTLTNIVAGVLGDYAVAASRDLLVAQRHASHPTGVTDLFRARFAHSGEIGEGARLDEAFVKSLTGGDEQRARRMREDFWSFQPTHTFWLHANHRPVIRGNDDGIWRRLMLVPFNVQIPEDERDRQLTERIVDTESAGVLRWLMDGLADYHEQGLNPPKTVIAATKRYRDESDTINQFISQELELDPRGSIRSIDLTERHRTWCIEEGIPTRDIEAHFRGVTKRLKALDAQPKRISGQRSWAGVRATHEEQENGRDQDL